MVCLACLLPLFLIPVVNALPVLFYLIMEYRKPQVVPPAFPYRPAAKQNSNENLPDSFKKFIRTSRSLAFQREQADLQMVLPGWCMASLNTVLSQGINQKKKHEERNSDVDALANRAIHLRDGVVVEDCTHK